MTTIEAQRFTSFTALRAAHGDLLKRQHAAGSIAGMLPDVLRFIDLARCTGALLDNDQERQTSQSLIDYWVAILYRERQKPPDSELVDYDPALAPMLPDEPSPYRGLDAFQDSRFFYGRERLIDEFLATLKQNHLLAVVGASGSGKSSAVLGGLLPKLKAGALPGSDGWRYIVMVPGADPVTKLQQQLQAAQPAVQGAPSAPSTPGAPITVIVVDQFEEVFTLCTDEAVRKAFTAELLRMAGAGDYVVLTMRSDFEDNLARLPDFQAPVMKAVVEARALDINELRAVIERPAAEVGLKFAPGIVDDLISTILGERAGLPLLQFTLLQLWEHRDHNRITAEVYKQVGNPREALERSAEQLYNSQIPEDQDTTRRIFLKLVKPDVGLEFTSKRALVYDLYLGSGATDRVDRVLERLIAARLLRVSNPVWKGRQASQTAQVEVAHETLVRNWHRLVDWLDDERVLLRRRLVLTETAQQWNASHDNSLLLHGASLEDAEGYEDLSPDEAAFVSASRDVVDAARNRQHMLLWAAIGVLILVALALGALAVWAFSAQTRADHALSTLQVQSTRESFNALARLSQNSTQVAANMVEMINNAQATANSAQAIVNIAQATASAAPPQQTISAPTAQSVQATVDSAQATADIAQSTADAGATSAAQPQPTPVATDTPPPDATAAPTPVPTETPAPDATDVPPTPTFVPTLTPILPSPTSAPARATSTPVPTATPAPAAHLSAVNNRASYNPWGKQTSPNACTTNDSLGSTLKFDLLLVIANTGRQNLSGLRATFIGADGRSLVACVDLSGGNLPSVPINTSSAPVPIHTFTDFVLVQSLQIVDGGGNHIGKLCFSGLGASGSPNDVSASPC